MEANRECMICERLELWKKGKNPYVIHEFEHSLLVIGDHQFHKGYSVLLAKTHVESMLDLSEQVQSSLMRDLFVSAQALVATFQPWRMNYSCYGNLVPHVHWHLFPRYTSDPDHMNNPWVRQEQFKDHLISHEEARNLARNVSVNLVKTNEFQGP